MTSTLGRPLRHQRTVEPPDFLIIGAEAAGTSILEGYLQQHPGVYLTEAQQFEPWPAGLDDGLPVIDRVDSPILDDQGLLRNYDDPIAIGAVRPWYLADPHKAAEIMTTNVPVRLVVMLRNPIERAYDSFQRRVQEGQEACPDFRLALQQEVLQIQTNWDWVGSYIRPGFYAEQLVRYYARFSAEQIRVYFYEDLLRSPLALLQDLCRFLEIDPIFVPPKSRYLLSNSIHPFGEKPRRNSYWSLEPLKNFGQPVLSQLDQPLAQLSDSLKSYLTEIYQEDILDCQDLLIQDLSHWLRTSPDG